ncbi:hypothetical protein CONLIGDRAFT_440504 [Coniochaeta ligniaria NRRL 30616]|uniref:BZIP domain-containing protein n=1 Tax=Coniochaeta ligniaria NRRL 30616 TaxID=1408157 RepID=A0A1J7JEB4_9PEZI|nr:hypothetical protein CONLIGDRAFT_440504 [Coniochaeta ligniaria NRRL 30616]
MASFNSRRGPNVSQYLRELHTIPEQDTAAGETFNMDDDLAMFTNTQFFDFDSGQNTDYNAPPLKPETTEAAPQQSRSEDVIGDLVNYHDFNAIPGDFNLDYASTYTSPTIPTFSETLANLQPIQPNPHSVYQSPISQHAPGYPAPDPRIGEKRKSDASSVTSASSPNRPLSFEEASRVAAEEDKRRRNTAASARFRIKKKQREQALEKSAKEMNDKVAALENRIQQLETENKWLKNLIMEKNEKTEKGEDVKDIDSQIKAAKQKVGDSITAASSVA